jgi:hypothetical protein
MVTLAALFLAGQGGEADLVVFSATVSDEDAMQRSADFYTSMARANVAFSRAKKCLVVVVSQAFLHHTPAAHRNYAELALWRQLRSLCVEHGEVLFATEECRVYGATQLVGVDGPVRVLPPARANEPAGAAAVAGAGVARR